jgi:hypothetical protein
MVSRLRCNDAAISLVDWPLTSSSSTSCCRGVRGDSAGAEGRAPGRRTTPKPVEDGITFDRHGADLDVSASPVAQDHVNLVVSAGRAATHSIDFGCDAFDVLRRYDGRVQVSGPLPDCSFRGVVEPQDSAVRVADEARHVDALKRRLQHLSCRPRRHGRPPRLTQLRLATRLVSGHRSCA